MAKSVTPPPHEKPTPRKVRKIGGPNIPPLTVFGDLVDRVDVLPISSLNLVMTIGRTEQRQDVIVPYLEFRIRQESLTGAEPQPRAGEEESEPEVTFDKLITFENAAFLIMDMASDFARVSEQLAGIARGQVGLEAERRHYALQCLDRASDHIRRATAELTLDQPAPRGRRKPT